MSNTVPNEICNLNERIRQLKNVVEINDKYIKEMETTLAGKTVYSSKYTVETNNWFKNRIEELKNIINLFNKVTENMEKPLNKTDKNIAWYYISKHQSISMAIISDSSDLPWDIKGIHQNPNFTTKIESWISDLPLNLNCEPGDEQKERPKNR